jgi:Bacterial Ig-like domain (group 2)
VPLGSTLQLTVTGTFSDGSTQDITQQVTWSIDNPTIAAITPGGVVSGVQVGATGVEASFNGVQTSDTVTVQPLLNVAYFDATSGIDSTIRVTNPGMTGKDLCTMIYVFDKDQQMSECCGCLISQDGLLTLSLKKNLLSNPLTGVASTAGIVMLVSAQQSSIGGCNAASVTPAGNVVAWATHLPQSKSGAISSAEVPFSSSALGTAQSSSLQAQCSFIQQLGSGQGLCGCGTGQP